MKSTLPNTTKFARFYFESKYGMTAALILTTEQCAKTSLVGLANMFPHSECLKLETCYRSPWFDSWEDCANYEVGRAKDVLVGKVNIII